MGSGTYTEPAHIFPISLAFSLSEPALILLIFGIPSVLVSDGETVVLGGIFQQEKRNSVAKTPFLGDLPWIGKLFSRTTKVDDKQELLIFITPRLMKDALANR